MLDPFAGLAAQGAHRADPGPRLLHARAISPRLLAASASRRDAHDDVEPRRSQRSPAAARVLIFGSLYLAGAVLAANGQVPD